MKHPAHKEASDQSRNEHAPDATSQSLFTSQLIGYLPAIYQEGNLPDQPSFLARYLGAFETVLIGSPELRRLASDTESDRWHELGLEEKVDQLPQLFSPSDTPSEFLPWLATWTALSFHPELAENRRRLLLANIVPLYRIRGTRKYLARLLEICVDATIVVDDSQPAAFQIQQHSRIGKDAYLGGGPPHYFTVSLQLPLMSLEDEEIQVQIARSVIEYAKPAHTAYSLSVTSPRMPTNPEAETNEADRLPKP